MFAVVIIKEWLSFIFIALALGLDGFSVCLAIGMYKIRIRRMVLIGLIIGCFHMLLPFIGLLIGHMMSLQWTHIAATIGYFLLVFMGLYIIFSALQQKDIQTIYPYGLRLLTVIFLTSIDSFPVGISLGLAGVEQVLFILLFGVITTILGWLGLIIGKKTSELFGIYSEIIGGFILLSFGLWQLFMFAI